MKKKAFTVIELVIVIAVLGILTAILIPTFIGVSDKAKVASDTALARNLSTSLRLADKEVTSVKDIKREINKAYGDDFAEKLAPQTVDKGNHFWYNTENRMVELKTLEEISHGEATTKFDSSFRSNIKDGYVLLDGEGSELALIASLIESVYSRMECDRILDYFSSNNDIADNFIANLSNTLIVNENGCLRGSDYNDITNIYFMSDDIDLEKLTFFEFSEDKIEFKNISLDNPLAGDGLAGQTINIKKSMYFGTGTFLFKDSANVTLAVDVNSVNDLKDVFAASSTNAFLKINNGKSTYRIVDDTIVEVETRQVVVEDLTYTVNRDVLGYQFPAMSETSITQTVGVNNNKVSTETNISNGESQASATIPAGTKVDTDTLTLSVTEKEASESNIEIGTYAGKAIDVHVEGISKDNNVPIIVDLGEIMPPYLNNNSLEIYHIEDYDANQMTRVYSVDELIAHNTFYYEPDTGHVIIALKSFSEVYLRAGTVSKWDGRATYGWYNDNPSASVFTINSATDLAGLANIVNGDADGITKFNFQGRTVRLATDILINDWELTSDAANAAGYKGSHTAMGMSDSSTNDPAFFGAGETAIPTEKFRTFTPIGGKKYTENGKTYLTAFRGNFDGDNHIVSGLFGLYVNDPMRSDRFGLFGCVQGPSGDPSEEGNEPITIQNLRIDDSWFYYYGGSIGLVTSSSYGNVTYDNIKITRNYVSQYNWNSGGIISYLYPGSNVTLNNIVVDDTNLFEALWGTYDAAVAGLIGNVEIPAEAASIPHVTLSNCQVYPKLNVYNDACANYQWFAFRYTGMLIGYLEPAKNASVDTFLRDYLSCTNVLVHYEDWVDQYYCELKSLGQGSYNEPHDWKYTRIKSDQVLRDGEGNIIGCDETKTLHHHEDYPEDEDHAAKYLKYDQLFGGGQGFYGINTTGYETIKEVGVGASGVRQDTSIITFNVDGKTTRQLAINGADINLDMELEKYSYKLYKWSDGSSLFDGTYTVSEDVELTATWKQRVALNPGVWDTAGARFAVYAYNEAKDSTIWVDLEEDTNLNVYVGYVPVTNIWGMNFARMNPNYDYNQWNTDAAKDHVWNQTKDIKDAASHVDYTLNITGWQYSDSDKDSPYTWVNRYIFLKENNYNPWFKDGVRFAVYYFKSSDNTIHEWEDMKWDGDNSRYYCEAIHGYDRVIFVRMNPAHTENQWDSGDGSYVWNQTEDLTFTITANTPTYTITGQGDGKASGYWS